FPLIPIFISAQIISIDMNNANVILKSLFGWLFVLVSVLFFSTEKLYATHAVGADFSYECLGNNQYRVTLNLYRDCAGVSAPTSVGIRIASSCSSTSTVTLPRISFTEVSPICPSQQSLSRCQGGSFPGIEQYVYQGIITLSGPCANWTFSYTLCCRNNAITNLSNPGNREIYIQAVVNNTNGRCNNSPIFTTLPVPYICNNQQFYFNHGAVDIDGNDL